MFCIVSGNIAIERKSDSSDVRNRMKITRQQADLTADRGYVIGFVSCSPSPCKHGGICMSSPKGESYCKSK
ncbi:unnamed protein product [Acanthoscelides obtectus]|uniref:Uncharacterized protein n=1 Tax=Acanthoscelides obtectus TaxID=200917 RepID=A0A9P0KSW4_ACAOB|nr:unnamed protein product [Acanthoscelides obtectus]CAK1653838.1 hypothetical protein AOBTE_LOCUS18381 [Acanthoscelides obtectus]